MAQPIKIAICCTILIPVCLACHDFLLLQTAFKKGSNDGIPRAEATTANALKNNNNKNNTKNNNNNDNNQSLWI